MNLLKKKNLVGVNIIKSNCRRICVHCNMDILTKHHVAAFEFALKQSKLYTHFDCKDEYIKTLR